MLIRHRRIGRAIRVRNACGSRGICVRRIGGHIGSFGLSLSTKGSMFACTSQVALHSTISTISGHVLIDNLLPHSTFVLDSNFSRQVLR